MWALAIDRLKSMMQTQMMCGSCRLTSAKNFWQYWMVNPIPAPPKLFEHGPKDRTHKRGRSRWYAAAAIVTAACVLSALTLNSYQTSRQFALALPS